MSELVRAAAAPAPHPSVSREGCTLRVLQAELTTMEHGACPGTAEKQGALVLLAALRVGPNVVRLARLTQLPPSLVAQIARRCLDNGIWQEGQTVCSWELGTPDPLFWLDARVAAGELLRRVSPEGQLEWAETGFWHKDYDFIQRDLCSANRYHEAAPDVAAEPVPTEASSETGSPRTIDMTPWLPARDPEPLFEAPRSPVADRISIQRVVRHRDVARAHRSSANELFPDAAWLG